MFDQDRLISYKQNFTGQKFQWIKTDRPELIGKVVKCRDVEPMGNMIMAIFDDGSKLDASKINSCMMMLHGDTQPLSKEEVESIYGANQPKPQPKLETQPINEVPIEPTNTSSNISEPISNAKAEPKPNMFEMFNAEDTTITISLQIKLPNKRLLKMMYESSEDKEKFLEELSEYVHSMINKNVINTSVSGMIIPPVKKKADSKDTLKNAPVKFTEVNGE